MDIYFITNFHLITIFESLDETPTRSNVKDGCFINYKT